MKFNIIGCLSAFIYTISSTTVQINDDQPLHIGVSITFATQSHVKYLLEICQGLSQKGHKITYLSINQLKKFGDGYNVTHYPIGDAEIGSDNFGDMKPFTSNDSFDKGFDSMVATFAKIYGDSFIHYEKFYKEEKPDLMICDYNASSCIESAIKNKIPFIIGYQSLIFGANAPYITLSGLLEPTTIENHTFLQRMKHSLIDPIMKIKTNYPFMKAIAPHRQRHQVPETWTFPVFNYLGLGIANSYIGFEKPRKVSSHIHLIGPIVSDSVPDLPQDLRAFLDNRSKVLYVAFGSMIRLIPDLTVNLLQHFQRALNDGIIDGVIWGGLAHTNFDDFPKGYTVDSQEYSTKSIIDGSHDKIKLLKWAPQESILHHSNTKLFLSHGGLDSVYESLYSGTPMLVIPFFGDQPRNAMLITENGVGDYIEWPTMGDEIIYQKLVKLLDPKNLDLQSKVQQLQLITKFSSQRKEMAGDLIETYALGARSCRVFDTAKPFEIPCEMKPYLPLDYKMNSIKANLIDVYLVAFLIFSISIIGICYGLIKLILSCFSSKIKQKVE